MIDYDPETCTATFLISITQWGNQEVGGDKITFSVDRFLSDKQEFDASIPQVDLSTANISPQILSKYELRGTSWNGEDTSMKADMDNISCLAPSASTFFSPVDGVTITAIGFIDGELHIQVYYDDILNTDNHGDVWLEGTDGETHESYGAVHFWDEERVGSYSEYIFDVSPDEISAYSLHGYFETCSTVIEGDWQVTFPLEYEE